MKSITRLSLALIMFSLFSISYLVTSAFAQEGAGGAPMTGDPCMVVPAGPDRDACYATTPPPTGMAPAGTPGMPPTGMAPAGTPDMQGEDCAAMPTPTETADCWKRQNDPLLGAPAQ
jgi:hypothetical protein